MEASQQAWIAEQHGADAVLDDLALLPRVSLPHGGVLALALDMSVSDSEVAAALGDDYTIISADLNPSTNDYYILARRTVTKAKKK